MKKIFQYMAFGLLAFCLTIIAACSAPSQSKASKKNASISAPPTYHPLTAKEKKLVKALQARGVQVIKQGDRLTMILPADRFFRKATSDVKHNKKPTMRRVARFVKLYSRRFDHPVIWVNGYSDTVFARSARRSLSQAYAQVVTSYLWAFGVPKNIIRTHGYGAGRPIADRSPTGAAYNRRVEIIIK